MNESVVWAQPPEGEQAASEREEKEGELDETFALRRLQRWLSGMFGVPQREPDDRNT